MLNLVEQQGDKPGEYLQILTGIGNKSTVVFTPLSKVIWIILGYTFNFSVNEGDDLSSIRVNVQEMKPHMNNMFKIAAGFLSLSHKNDSKKYSTEMFKRDFALEIDQVNVFLY